MDSAYRLEALDGCDETHKVEHRGCLRDSYAFN
jgi:hypothetical protein